jgi:hypothetical protein
MFEAVSPSWFRQLDEPRRVWVNVHRLLARDVHDIYRDTPGGLELDHEVHGLVDAWARRGDGGWLARVSYQLPARNAEAASELITHYVPSHLITPHSYVRRDRERHGLGH